MEGDCLCYLCVCGKLFVFIFSSRACLNVHTRQRKEHRRLRGSAVLPAKQVKLHLVFHRATKRQANIGSRLEYYIIEAPRPDHLYLYIPLRFTAYVIYVFM